MSVLKDCGLAIVAFTSVWTVASASAQEKSTNQDQAVEARAARACAGWGDYNSKSQGSVAVDDLSIKGNGNGTVTVYRNGVDLGHFSQGTFDQYQTCLVTVIKLISPQNNTKVDPPTIPDFSSDWVEGGHSTATYCDPLREAYAQKYPAFNIIMTPLAEEARWTGIRHREYKYHCSFAAQLK